MNHASLLIIPGEKNQDRGLILPTNKGKEFFLALADGAGDTINGGYAAECILLALKKVVNNCNSNRTMNLFTAIHEKALILLNDKKKNPDRKALAAYAIAHIIPEKVTVGSMGDVMFAVYRNRQLVFQSPEFVRYDHWITKGLMLDFSEDEFDVIETTSFSFKTGDLLIGATDGLWDNCRPEEVNKYLRFNENVDDIVRKLGQVSHERKGYIDDRAIIAFRQV